MLCAVINGPSFAEAKQQIVENKQHAAMFEFRIDHFLFKNLKEIDELKILAALPVIFTLRPKWMGGYYVDSEELRLKDLFNFCSLMPAYVDVETKEFVERIRQSFPQIKIILSHHDYEKTPDNLETLHASLKATPVDYYKLATHACCSSDALRFMQYLKNANENVIGVSMGSHGLPSRLLNKQFHSPWTYVGTSAPGQLTYHEMATIYGCSTSKETKLFGLIGAPINKSISHHTHNAIMRDFQLNALYIKMEISPQKLGSFLKQLQEFGWQGLSVTMPLKEAILPFMDEIDAAAVQIGAVNTVLFKEGKLHGFNTDGKGAVCALENICELKNKKVALLGKGGAAKAIAYEASSRGCQTIFFGRGLEDFRCEEFDIVINCTPVELPFDPTNLKSTTVVMDINTIPKQSALLKIAAAKGCPIVYGVEMFLYQALFQFTLWFPQLDPSSLEDALKRECRKVLNLID